MVRAHDLKMTPVGRQNIRRIQTLRRCNHRRIDEANIQIGVLPYELAGTNYILRFKGFDHKLSVRHRADER